jgi:trigger factor
MEVGAETNFPAFNEQITGTREGQEAQITVTYPEDYTQKALSGRTITFQCLVKEVQQKILPELNDAFSSRLREGETLLELRQRIREDLLQEEKRRVRRELEEQLVDALIERNDVSVPPSLVENYIKSGLEELHGRNVQLGRPVSQEEDDHYRKVTQPVAERVMKGMFIMEAIRKQEGITVSDEDVEEHISEVARENNFDLQKYREFAAQGSERDRIVHALEERKTFDFLLSRAKFKKAEAAAE